MKRAQLIFAALAIVAASFVAISGPVMAKDLNCRDARGNLIRCHGDLHAPYSNNRNDFYNPYYYSNYYDPYYYGNSLNSPCFPFCEVYNNYNHWNPYWWY